VGPLLCHALLEDLHLFRGPVSWLLLEWLVNGMGRVLLVQDSLLEEVGKFPDPGVDGGGLCRRDDGDRGVEQGHGWVGGKELPHSLINLIHFLIEKIAGEVDCLIAIVVPHDVNIQQ